MIRILYTIPNFLTAGSGQALVNIISRLDRARFAPSVAVLKSGGALEERLRALDVPVFQANFAFSPRPYASLPARVLRAARPLRARPFDLWHSFHYSDDYTEPLVAYASGARAWMYTKKNMGWGGRAWRLRSWLARGIAAQNTTIQAEFFHHHPRVRYIPPGIAPEDFAPAPSDPALRQTLGAPPDGALLVHVAHMAPVKNHAFSIEALAKTRGNVSLALVGGPLDGDYARSLQQQVNALGLAQRVCFAGARSDIVEVLRAADIFVFCSHQEACPVAVLEAMAAGLPGVVTGIPAMRDIHIAGETALVTPPGDTGAFAAALDQLAADPVLRDRLGSAARQRCAQRFRIQREVEQYQAMYLDLLR